MDDKNVVAATPIASTNHHRRHDDDAPQDVDDSVRKKIMIYREFLTDEHPKIDAALKSYASWMLATTATANGVGTSSHHQQQLQPQQRLDLQRKHLEIGDVLRWTRILSQTINRHVVAVTVSPSSCTRSCSSGRSDSPEKKSNDKDIKKQGRKDNEWQAEVLAQVWNNVVAMKSKPTKMLGRTALQGVWKDLEFACDGINLDVEDHELMCDMFLPPFERFLMGDSSNFHHALVSSSVISSSNLLPGDARLIWDADRGAAELSRRSQERNEQAARRRDEEARQKQTPTIDEEEEEGED